MPSPPSQPPRNHLLGDVLILFGVQFTGYLLPLVTLPYLTRTLGPTNFGLLALGSAFALYFSIVVDYGFAVTGTRRVAAASDADAVTASRVIGETYYTIHAAKLLLLLGCLIVYLVALFTVPKLFAQRLLYLVGFLHVIGFGFSPNWFFQGLGKMRWVAISDYGAKAASVACIFLAVKSPGDYIYAAAFQAGGFFVSALIGHAVIQTLFRPRWIQPSFKGVAQALREAWPVFLSFASLIAMSSTNTLILGFTSSPAATGFLNAAQRLIIAARALTNPITNAVYPKMSRLASSNRSEAFAFLRQQVLVTAIPFALISIGLFLLGPWVAHLLYGPQFVETGILLRILSPTPLAHAMSMCFSTYFMLAFGHEKIWNRFILASVALNFLLIPLLMLILPPSHAIATTSVAVDIFSAGASFWYYRRCVQRENNADSLPTFDTRL